MPREFTDHLKADGTHQGERASHRTGQQAQKRFPAYGPIAIVFRDGSKCPLRVHDPLQVGRPRPGNGGGGPTPAA